MSKDKSNHITITVIHIKEKSDEVIHIKGKSDEQIRNEERHRRVEKASSRREIYRDTGKWI